LGLNVFIKEMSKWQHKSAIILEGMGGQGVGL